MLSLSFLLQYSEEFSRKKTWKILFPGSKSQSPLRHHQNCQVAHQKPTSNIQETVARAFEQDLKKIESPNRYFTSISVDLQQNFFRKFRRRNKKLRD